MKKTVILGEASEDSDEEISLYDDKNSGNHQQKNSNNQDRLPIKSSKEDNTRTGGFGSTLFRLFGSSISTTEDNKQNYNLPLLHRTLYSKNQQFYSSMSHLYKHPYEKATKDFNNINQRLVNLQRNLQDADTAITKIKRERKNLDMVINMIP